MVRSKRCRTTVCKVRNVLKRGAAEILRVARRETSETKYEGRCRFQVGRRFAQQSRSKKIFVVAVLHRKFTIRQQVFHTRALRSLTRLCFGKLLLKPFHARARRRACSLCALLLLVCVAAPAFAESVTLFRVFLNDGTAIVSYGEYARVGDRLVFSMPIGAVDVDRRGDPEPSRRQSAGVGGQLDCDRPGMPTSARLCALHGDERGVRLRGARRRRGRDAERHRPGEGSKSAPQHGRGCARRRLASWPRDHYGYRADDVREMLGLLDEAISGLRVAAGETSFAIDLVATAPPRRIAATICPCCGLRPR